MKRLVINIGKKRKILSLGFFILSGQLWAGRVRH